LNVEDFDFDAAAKAAEEQADQNQYRLPPFESIQASDPPPRNPPLIHGIVRLGHVMLIVGKGKGSKTWTAIELAEAVMTGGKWFGYQCERGDVLYVDPELDRKSLDNRFNEVAVRQGIDAAEIDKHSKKWCLRGVLTAEGEAPTIADLAHDVALRCERGDFSLVVIDSASCFIEGDENTAGDVRRFFAYVLRIAEATGAAVLVVHHMGKGDKGDWASIERSRGSSVWGDAPDAPLSLIEIFPPSGEPSDYLQDGERAFMLEDSGLREFPGIKPRHVIFNHPTHRVDVDGITATWTAKGAANGSEGGKAKGQIQDANRERDFAVYQNRIVAELLRRETGGEGITCQDAAEVLEIPGKKQSAKLADMFREFGECREYTSGAFTTKEYVTELLAMRKQPSKRNPEEPGKAWYIFPRFNAGQMALDIDG